MTRLVSGLAASFLLIGWASGCTGGDDPESEPRGQQSAALPASAVNDAMMSCMASRGWTGELGGDGGIEWGSIPDSQVAALNADQRDCVDSTGWGDLAALTTEERRSMYAAEVAEFACLQELGLDPPQPPTEQSYLDTFNSAEQYYAFKGLSLTPQQTLDCPPPTLFMN